MSNKIQKYLANEAVRIKLEAAALKKGYVLEFDANKIIGGDASLKKIEARNYLTRMDLRALCINGR